MKKTLIVTALTLIVGIFGPPAMAAGSHSQARFFPKGGNKVKRIRLIFSATILSSILSVLSSAAYAANDTVILWCGGIDVIPGISIINSSSSVIPPPVDLSFRTSCSGALAGLLTAGAKLIGSASAGVPGPLSTYTVVLDRTRARPIHTDVVILWCGGDGLGGDITVTNFSSSVTPPPVGLLAFCSSALTGLQQAGFKLIPSGTAGIEPAAINNLFMTFTLTRD